MAFAGFSAVVSIFDRRADRDDPRIRHYRMRVMVEYSLCVSIFSFVPYLLNATLGSEDLAWRLSSAGLAIVWSTIGLSARGRARDIFGKSTLVVAPGFTLLAMVLGYAGAAILVANVIGFSIRTAGASYIVGLFLPLAQSALYFLRIVVHGDPIKRPGE